MKKALVCGAGGFIGSHLVKRLVADGFWVRGVDVKLPDFGDSAAHEFRLLDLRESDGCADAVRLPEGSFDEVYQLAADMGGMGFIHSAECEILHNNTLINTHMVKASVDAGVARYFYSSSACVYRDMTADEPAQGEELAYPAAPDNEYGWEKLYAERVAMAHARRYPIDVRIARFQNCFGPEGTWDGGREKAPAAICRKVAMASDGGTIEVWGDGSAVRSYTYIDDMLDGVLCLMRSGMDTPTNIGSPEYVTVDELVAVVADVAGKDIRIEHVDGPVGVAARNHRNDRIYSLGWSARHSLRDGIAETYPWIAEQIRQTRSTPS